MLAASLRGRIESVMQAHGFAIGTLHGLVQEGLATADRGPARFDPRAIVTVLETPKSARASRRRMSGVCCRVRATRRSQSGGERNRAKGDGKQARAVRFRGFLLAHARLCQSSVRYCTELGRSATWTVCRSGMNEGAPRS